MSGAGDWTDISIAFAPTTPPWPGDTAFTCGWAWSMSGGGSVNVSRIETSPHVGTHADAPLHVMPDGAGADAIPLGPFSGAARVVDVSELQGEIPLDALREAGWQSGVERLIVRTGHSVASGHFPAEWPTLSADAARALAADGLRLLAVDCPSVDARESKTLDVHRVVFGAGAFVLENLDLTGVEPGLYELRALPLKVGAIDAAPVRALLRPLPASRGARA